MAIEDDLLNAIQTSLGNAVVPSLTATPDQIDGLFEAYIFGLLIDEARNVGAVTYGGLSGGPPLTFIFRTSPAQGYITPTDPYSYAVITFNRKASLEAHVGIYVSGRSEVSHECDVALLSRAEAETCRNSPDIILPRHSEVLLAIECKYYTSNLRLYLARQFIGLVADLSVKDTYFVTNSTSSTVAKLLISRGKRLRWEPDTIPDTTSIAINAVNRLRGLFKELFKDYLGGK